MEPALLLPANPALMRPITIVRVQAIEVLLPNQLIVSGYSVLITAAEYAWIKTKVSTTSPP